MRGGCVALGLLLLLAGPVRADSDTVVINLAGDVGYPDGWERVERVDRDKHRLFRLVKPIIAGADLNFVNLECPFTKTKPTVKKTYPMSCKPKRLGYVVRAGFNLFSLANNHTMDAGERGVLDTLANLRRLRRSKKRLWWAGTGADRARAMRGVRFRPPGKSFDITLFAVNSSSAKHVGSIYNRSLVKRVARAAKRSVVLVSVHKGWEYYHVPQKDAVRKYRKLIDAGATLVIGHHPHVVQGVERYKRGLIFYSLGNFSFGSYTTSNYARRARMYSMIARVTLSKRAIKRAELIPLYVGNKDPWVLRGETIPPRFATPQLLSGKFAKVALDEITTFTKNVPLPGKRPTRLIRVGDRALVYLGKRLSEADREASLMLQAAEWAHVKRLKATPRPATVRERKFRNTAGTPRYPWRHRLPKKRKDKRRK